MKSVTSNSKRLNRSANNNGSYDITSKRKQSISLEDWTFGGANKSNKKKCPRNGVKSISIVLLVWSMSSCINNKYIQKSDWAIRSSHDSVAIEVGIKEGNLVYFTIENQRQFDYLALDTATISLLAGVGNLQKSDLLITNMARENPHLATTQYVVVKCDSLFYYESRIDKPITRLGLMLSIIVLDGQQTFSYNKDVGDMILNYKSIQTVRVGQVSPTLIDRK